MNPIGVVFLRPVVYHDVNGRDDPVLLGFARFVVRHGEYTICSFFTGAVIVLSPVRCFQTPSRMRFPMCIDTVHPLSFFVAGYRSPRDFVDRPCTELFNIDVVGLFSLGPPS